MALFTDRNRGKHVILVTGASSGIGLELARLLWQSSFRVVITVRKQSLKKLESEPFSENERFLIRTLDINNFKEQTKLIEEINRLWDGVDILVNNAGISYRAVIEHMDETNELLQLNTNYLAPMNLIRLVLPKMRSKREGQIINVSSVGGMMAMPTMGSYSASKFALEGATEALWYEMRPWKIKVSLVQPGFINSDSFKHVYSTNKVENNFNAYKAYYSNMSAFIEKLMHMSVTTPQGVARTILSCINNKNPPLRVPATPDALFFSLLRRLLPRGIYHRLLYWGLPGVKDWGKDQKD